MGVRTGGILTLDLSSVVGWAYGHPGDDAPVFGTWHLSTSRLLGPRYVSYENELIACLNLYMPRLVVMEAPLPSIRQGSTNVARQQFGLAAYTEGECHRFHVQLREQPAHMVRKAVLGRGSFGEPDPANPRRRVNGRANAKSAVMEWCQAQGWNVPDDNAADACVLWRYSCEIESRTRSLSG